ncbi:MAG: YeeE/YedE thiosulfate transporter family protein [Polyangiaceae bacterium]
MTCAKHHTLSPYVAGAGIGALQCFAAATSQRTIGVTSPFESTAAAVQEKLTSDPSVHRRYAQAAEQEPKLDWEWMLAAGTVLGAYVAANAERTRPTSELPMLWRRRFGTDPIRRTATAFLGGTLMMFGARMAKGCTSGHCISGTAQLGVSSWLFSVVMGATALRVARSLFGVKP